MTTEAAGFASVELGYGAQQLARESKKGERTPQGTSRDEGGDRTRGEGRARGAAAGAALVPHRRRAGQEPGDADVQARRHDHGRHLRRRRAGEGRGHVEGTRIPGRREALRLPRRTEHARQHEASPARLDRRRHRIPRASSRARRCLVSTAIIATRTIGIRIEKIDAERNLIYSAAAWRGRPTASSSCASRADPDG